MKRQREAGHSFFTDRLPVSHTHEESHLLGKRTYIFSLDVSFKILQKSLRTFRLCLHCGEDFNDSLKFQQKYLNIWVTKIHRMTFKENN